MTWKIQTGRLLFACERRKTRFKMKGWIQGFALRPRPKKGEDFPIVLTWKNTCCFSLFQKNGCLRIYFAEGLFREIKKICYSNYRLMGSQQTTVRFHRIQAKRSEGSPILLIRSEMTQLPRKFCVTFLSCYVSCHQHVTLLSNVAMIFI